MIQTIAMSDKRKNEWKPGSMGMIGALRENHESLTDLTHASREKKGSRHLSRKVGMQKTSHRTPDSRSLAYRIASPTHLI